MKKDIRFDDVIDILSRRKWHIIYSFLLIMFIASVYCVKATEMFKSQVSILVIQPEISSSVVETTVSKESLGFKVNTIAKKLFTKSRMMELIDELGLFPGMRGKVPDEKLVKTILGRVDIGISGAQNSFELAYISEDPLEAMRITSGLASMFIRENQQMRGSQVTGTTEFLSSEIEKAKLKLDEKDELIKKFRIKYFGELPEQLDSNIRKVTSLEEKIKNISEEKKALLEEKAKNETRLSALKNKAAALNIDLSMFDKNSEVENADLPRDVMLLLKQIGDKKQELLQMRVRYTDNHPLMRQTKHVIEELEKKLRKTQVDDEETRKALERYVSIPVEGQGIVNKGILLYERRKEIDKELAALAKTRIETEQLIEKYNSRIENTPRRELELKDLTRDYQTVKNYYNDLLKKKMNAELSVNLETRKKGEQFQMIDPPTIPETPIKPNRKRILMIGLLLSVTIGFGGAFGFEFLKKTIHTPEEFKDFFSLPILISLPLIITKEHRKKIVIKKICLYGGLIVYVMAVTMFISSNADKIRSLLSLSNLGL